VAIADFFTTFAALAGVDGIAEPNPESPFAVDGVDMWSYFTGANATSPRTEYVYDNLNFTKDFSACTYDGTVQVVPCRGAGAIRVGPWKLMVGTFGYVSAIWSMTCCLLVLLSSCARSDSCSLCGRNYTGWALRSVFAKTPAENRQCNT
jgi:hypothetical protein